MWVIAFFRHQKLYNAYLSKHKHFMNSKFIILHQKKHYVNSENSVCEKYKPKIKGPLDKYIW
jgi:hypothetical protein